MAILPINIEDILSGGCVEWERLEFKRGWNPVEVLHTVSAFANDINNWGGGYIFIGIEEVDGRPKLPPTGLKASELDTIQKKLIELGNLLRPDYHPVVEPRLYQGKHILVLWCPGGSTRPYKAPKSLPSKDKKKAPLVYEYYIRRNSSTVVANEKSIRTLYERANQVPFDDQINHQAQLGDFSLSLIREFLATIKSDLASSLGSLSTKTLYRNMQIARGPEEYLMPVNVGLMMFCEHPELYFPYSQIEVVEYRNRQGDSFSEKIFKGPIHKQLSEALRYIQSLYIREEVRKIPNQAEALRFYNYPFAAIEESLANAIYHRDYNKREPVEVRIYPESIEIQSFPGPLPPITIEELNKGEQVKVREYRNRRIGDFLKELHLTEGRCTGIPKIRRALQSNGSPDARFETDDDRSYFLTTIPIHPLLVSKSTQSGLESTQSELESTQSGLESTQSGLESTQSGLESTHPVVIANRSISASLQVVYENFPQSIKNKLKKVKARMPREALHELILELCTYADLSAAELAELLRRKSKKALVRDHLTQLKDADRLEMVVFGANAANQKYRSKKAKLT